MVSAVRRGCSICNVANKYGVARSTVQFWVNRAQDHRLDRVDWADQPRGPRTPANKTSRDREDLVLSLRNELKTLGDLGEFGDQAIHRELIQRGLADPPAVRTIGRILARRGAVDGRVRVRRPPPPRGWYLPEVAAGRAEIDLFDIIEGLVIQDGPQVEILTAKALHAGIVAAWPELAITAKTVVTAMLEHWRQCGLPPYAQFDNDTRFQGPHNYPDAIGRVIRLCLSLGVIPVFAPPREPGFQAAIENFNGLWQAKVWRRFHHPSLTALQERSGKYVAASRLRAAPRTEAAPTRNPFPENWPLDYNQNMRGKIIFLRRTTATGTVRLLGRNFPVDPLWRHRLIRAQVELEAGVIRFYALRRREPNHQPLIAEVKYALPKKRFKEK